MGMIFGKYRFLEKMKNPPNPKNVKKYKNYEVK